MEKYEYLLMLGVSAAAGTALGMLADRRHTAKSGLLGATAGIVAGSVAAGVYQYIKGEQVPYYSNESCLYEDIEAV